MFSLIPEVHLFICLDPRISPGAILHCLDMARAQDWQQETILICDVSWKPFVNIDQPVLFIDKDRVFGKTATDFVDGIPYLESFLEQLDNFEIQRITQIGDLSWGRWLQVYFESETQGPCHQLTWSDREISSMQIVNDLVEELGLDLDVTTRDGKQSGAVYIDPYVDGALSPLFCQLIEAVKPSDIPAWVNIICKEEDFAHFAKRGFEDSLFEAEDIETSLFNQPVLCFSDTSILAHTSRSYNIAILSCQTERSLFVPGDIAINCKEPIHASELFNILSYWRNKRLKELAFQWMNMGIEIECVENFHGRVVKRNLLNYSTDLFHCQNLIEKFLASEAHIAKFNYAHFIIGMRKKVQNDPYALSFSLKILIMIIERMIASANGRERLFARLGSDYHRIVIGEALIEGLIDSSWSENKILNIKKKLEEFHRFLIKMDFTNDQMEHSRLHKETA